MKTFLLFALQGFCLTLAGVSEAGRTNLPAPSTITIAVDPATYLITGPSGVLSSNDVPTGASVSQTISAVTSNLTVALASTSGRVVSAQADIVRIVTNAAVLSNRVVDVEAQAVALASRTNAYMPTFTSRWSLVYSDGGTNKQDIPIGMRGTYLRSTGVDAAPVWDIPRAAATNLFLRDILDVIPENSILVGTGSNLAIRTLGYARSQMGLIMTNNLMSQIMERDGAGSGLDADTLDGFNSDDWLQVDNWFWEQGDTNRLWYGFDGEFWITFDTNVVSTFNPRYLASITNLTASGATWTNLGNGTWRLLIDSAPFASAAQGLLADTALQPTNFPPVQAFTITCQYNTNIIFVSNGGGMSETNAIGPYYFEGDGEYTRFGEGFQYILQLLPGLGEMFLGTNHNSSSYYHTSTSSSPPGVLELSYGSWTGTARVDFAQSTTTNAVTWSGVITNIVGVSTQILQYGSYGNLTNVLILQ